MRVVSAVLGLISLFFVFYTTRLLYVTHGLQQTRPGGQGAYVGAAVFPLLAIGFGWASVMCWRRPSRHASQTRAVWRSLQPTSARTSGALRLAA